MVLASFRKEQIPTSHQLAGTREARAAATLAKDLAALNALPAPRFGQIADNPEFTSVSSTLKQLQTLHLRLSQEGEIANLEDHFGSRAPKADSTRDQILVERLALLRSQIPAKPSPKCTVEGHSPTVAKALALADGGATPPPSDRVAKRADIARQLAIVEPAMREQELKLQQLIADLSNDRCREVRADHDRIVLAMFRAAQALAQAADAERTFRGELLRGGFTVAPDIISPPCLTAALVLGSESAWDSQISTVRRHLEAKGIL